MISCPSQAWDRHCDVQCGDTTQLEDDILGLLEAAGIETEVNDKICALIREGEKRKFEQAEAAHIKRPPPRDQNHVHDGISQDDKI
jgi:hypothetical protein